jgi:methionyl aminopeptidase
MIIVKNDRELQGMRASCRLAAQVRDALAREVAPGMSTSELAERAAALIGAGGGKSAFFGYRGFPGQICVSVNEEVVHGIPSERRLCLGDIVSLDVGVLLGSFFGDTATTVMLGVTDPAVLKLVRVTERALEAAIGMAVPGRRLSDISNAVQTVAEADGFSVVRDFVGHGIGKSLHEDPQIPNFGAPGRGPKLRAGMTLAIEPMVNMGRAPVKVLADGWTVVTRDARPSAHAEHTVVVRDGGAEVLTRSDG